MWMLAKKQAKPVNRLTTGGDVSMTTETTQSLL
jgi:hypothetical protein